LVRRPLIGVLYQPRMIDANKCGAVGGMRIGRGNLTARRKPAPVPLCPPQIPYELIWDRTRTAAVGSRRLTAELWHGNASSYSRQPKDISKGPHVVTLNFLKIITSVNVVRDTLLPLVASEMALKSQHTIIIQSRP
jgi:hypothetical protein